MNDCITFLKELPGCFSEIGAMMPSSKFLARRMVSSIRSSEKPLRILEVGPGTGPFTRQILDRMGPKDHFVVCELNPRFMSRLREKISSQPAYLRNRDRVEFFLGPVQELKNVSGHIGTYDVIVCSLPFANFTPDAVKEIFALFRELLAKDGSLTFCEYVGVRVIGRAFLNKDSRRRVKGVDRVMKEQIALWKRAGRVDRKFSLLNLPPAFAVQFKC